MTVTVVLAPNPVWAFLDNLGSIAAGGKIYTKNSDNITVDQETFMDSDGTLPWENPIQLDASGKQVALDGNWYPIYWSTAEKYYVRITDASDNTIADLYNFPISYPSADGSTSGTVNFISNPQFRLWWPQLLDTPVPASIEPLAPGGWGFVKNNTSATDTLSFPEFAVGQNDVPANPRYYFEYDCTGAGTGETEKYLYWYSSDVTTFAGSEIALQFWAMSTINSTLDLTFLQSFGAGGSPDVITPMQTINLTTTWTLYQIVFAVPSLSGKSIGVAGDDFIEVQFNIPLNLSSNIRAVNFDVRPGNLFATIIEQSLEEQQNNVLSSIIQAPDGSLPTGDAANNPPGYVLTVNSDSTAVTAQPGWVTGMVIPFRGAVVDIPLGWIPEIVGTIGNAASAATIRANEDVLALYTYYWTNYPGVKATVSGGTLGSAALDFAANKTMALNSFAGKVNGNFGQLTGGSLFTIGQQFGEQNHVLTIGEMPSHDHNVNGSPGIGQGAPGPNSVQQSGGTLTTTSTGGGAAHNTYQPTVFCVMIAKL